MKLSVLRCALLAAGLAMLAAGSGAGASEPTATKTLRFTQPREITNPFFPMALLDQDVLTSKNGRIERTLKPDEHRSFKLGNHTIEALMVEDREYKSGKLEEVARDYFAQADDGTVYYLGEDVDEYKDGRVVGHSGAWLLGRDTQRLGVLMPSRPRVGDKFQSEDVSKAIHEDDEVVSVSETVTVPAGTYRNCLKIKEKLADGAIEFKYYAPNVGCVKEEEPDAQFLLKSHSTRSTTKASIKNAPAADLKAPAATAASQPAAGSAKPPAQDPMARAALAWVGADALAELYWMGAINDPSLPATERQDLIEDLNEDGLSNPNNPSAQDLPLILSRLELIEDLAPYAMDQVNADAFHEAYKDLANMVSRLTTR